MAPVLFYLFTLFYLNNIVPNHQLPNHKIGISLQPWITYTHLYIHTDVFLIIAPSHFSQFQYIFSFTFSFKTFKKFFEEELCSTAVQASDIGFLLWENQDTNDA